MPLPEETVRAAMCSRINVLSNGHSGIRLKVVECMVDMLNKGVTPVVFDKGSVGACGDLSPMSQMALVLLGEGEAFYQGERMSGAEAMKAAGVAPIQFEARDGLAMHQRLQHDRGLAAAIHLNDADHYYKVSEIAAALTLEVRQRQHGGLRRADPQGARLSRRAIICAENIRRLTDDSRDAQAAGQESPGRLQPALHAAGRRGGQGRPELGALHVRDRAERRGRQPAVLPRDEDAYLTGANFQGTPLGIALDLVGAVR